MSDENQLFADQLIALIDRIFERTYFEHLNGASEDELIIEHDIAAASDNVRPEIQECVRRTIKCAVRAVDRDIGFHNAHEFLIDQLHEHVDKVIKAQARKQRSTSTAELQRFIALGITDNAVDKD